MPHKCGPMLMGVGWTVEFQSEVKVRSQYDKIEFVEQVKIEPSHEIAEGKSNRLLVGNYCLNLEDFKGDEEGRGRRENETETPKLALSKFFKDEVLEGKRKPKMIESFGFGTDPDAGKYMRLELESFRQVDFQYPAKLVWCGTSLSGGSLDEVEVSRQTRFQVRKLKAFTVTTENAKVRPELNLLSVLREQLETSWNRLQQETTEEPILVVECGVNDITNIGEERKEVEKLKRIDSKMRELVYIAADLKRQKKLQKVVLVQRIPRLDDKSRLSEISNQAMLKAVCEVNDPHGIIVRTLHLGGNQETLFGTPGLRNSKGQLPDGLHLRGPFGRAAFTTAAIEMLKNV